MYAPEKFNLVALAASLLIVSKKSRRKEYSLIRAKSANIIVGLMTKRIPKGLNLSASVASNIKA